MTILSLGIDTLNGFSISVMNVPNNVIIGYKTIEGNLSNTSYKLFAVINELFSELSIDYNHINQIACYAGPGSFTGIRVGISALKGMRIANDKLDIYSLTNLSVYAHRLINKATNNKNIFIISQAFANSYYCQLFNNQGIAIQKAVFINLDEINTILNHHNIDSTIFGGYITSDDLYQHYKTLNDTFNAMTKNSSNEMLLALKYYLNNSSILEKNNIKPFYLREFNMGNK